jgi:type II secretory pathway pseudopilin PulG
MFGRPSDFAVPTRRVRLRSDERGQSLIELLVAALVSVVVIGAIGALLVLSQRQQQKNANYDFAQSSAQAELDGMVGQIRSAWNIVSWGPNSVDMDVNLDGTDYQVYYECDISAGHGWNKCVRLQTAVGATLPSLSAAATVIPFISNGTLTNPVFSWTNETPTGGISLAPDYATAAVDVPASDGVTAASLSLNRTIVFSDGALIRNVDVQN